MIYASLRALRKSIVYCKPLTDDDNRRIAAYEIQFGYKWKNTPSKIWWCCKSCVHTCQ